jgi:hypothetical protein
MPPPRNSKSLSSTTPPKRYATRQLSKSQSPGQTNGVNVAHNNPTYNYRESSSGEDANDSSSLALTSSPEPGPLPIRKTREICTPEQKEELERFFEESSGYPSRAQKEALSTKIGK